MPRLKLSHLTRTTALAALLYIAHLIHSNIEEISAELRFLKTRYTSSASSSPPFQPKWLASKDLISTEGLWSRLTGQEEAAAGSSGGCSLPKLDPWDPGILEYVEEFPEIVCKSTQKSLLYTSKNYLLINKTAVIELGLSRSDITCQFSYVQYKTSDTYKVFDAVTISEDRVQLSHLHNSVYATCHRGKYKWMSYFLHEGISSMLGVELYRNLLIYVPDIQNKTVRDNPEAFSVVTLIFDSLSQMNLIRSFSDSLKVLEAHGAHVFKGHHKVGHNTYPNAMAILSGENGGDWPADVPDRSGMYYFDVERQPMIQNLFEKYNYLTFMMEDMQLYGTFTRVGRVGFKNPPAQIYYRAAFWSLVENWPALRNSLIGKFGAYACLQEKMLHQFQFRALEDFLEMYSEYAYHAHVHLTEYIHNDLNMAKHYDKEFSVMLNRLLSSGKLDNTFLFIIGDHGYQRAEGQFVLTEQGGIENNMPAFVILTPPNFSADNFDVNDIGSNTVNLKSIVTKLNVERMKKNLAKNTNRLTSHYDINQTLRDILKMSNASAENDLRRLEGHGASLFGKLKANRTCRQASIPTEYCSCVDGIKKIDLSDPAVIKLAQTILSDRYSDLQSLKLCQPLTFKNITDGWVKMEEGISLLKIQLQVEAGGAHFEIFVKQTLEEGISIQLTRQDWYSKTGRCLTKQQEYLKPYCICR